MISSSSIRKEDVEYPRLNEALYGCMDRNWCVCVCRLQISNLFAFTDMVVTGGTIDMAPGEKLFCYTKRDRAYIFEAVQRNAVINSFSNRAAENLIDGVYTHNIDDCYYAEQIVNDHLYLRFDFGKERLVKKIVIINQPSGAFGNKLHDLQFWLGNSTDGNLLENYELIGTKVDNPTKINETITII